MLLINDLGRQTQSLRPQINDAIQRVLDRGWFILGPELEAFEAEFSACLGAVGTVAPTGPATSERTLASLISGLPAPAAPASKLATVGVANGTDALELALRAVDIGPESRVATVAVAGMYATTAILNCGATPVYIDVAPGTTHMDLRQLAATPKLDAVVATHLYGRMEPMPQLLTAAAGVPVIEDCAQAHGAVLDGRAAGTWGALAAFSFYPTKNLGALGDGGAVTTSDPKLAARVRALRQYGWTSKYASSEPNGRNSRLDELQAAVLRLKLPRLDAWNERRRAIAALYDLAERPASPADVVHLYTIRHAGRDGLRTTLRALGIGAEVHYPTPDYRQPAVEARLGTQEPLPESERHCAETLTLPCFPEMTDAEVAETRRAVLESL